MTAPLLVITGPTAAGKTALALALAAELDAEIVGADSMQVYRGLDIGTDKPGAEQLGDTPHHMIDLVDPDEDYDAARFVADADQVISEVCERERWPLLVGGTGLYIRALLHGLHGGPAPDPEVRAEIESRAESVGWPVLHEELARVDPEAAERLHPNDGVRILRALEVFRQSGVPLTKWQEQHRFAEGRYPALVLGIERPREELHERIDRRIEVMMAQGFLDEVRGLLEQGYGAELKPLMGLGYRRLCQHLAGELELDEAVSKIRSDTRRLARRQLTWFREEPGLTWIPPEAGELMARATAFFEGVRG
jgi:tRNA dimethylallyltransferase